jgi:hypothetical protein
VRTNDEPPEVIEVPETVGHGTHQTRPSEPDYPHLRPPPFKLTKKSQSNISLNKLKSIQLLYLTKLEQNRNNLMSEFRNGTSKSLSELGDIKRLNLYFSWYVKFYLFALSCSLHRQSFGFSSPRKFLEGLMLLQCPGSGFAAVGDMYSFNHGSLSREELYLEWQVALAAQFGVIIQHFENEVLKVLECVADC